MPRRFLPKIKAMGIVEKLWRKNGEKCFYCMTDKIRKPTKPMNPESYTKLLDEMHSKAEEPLKSVIAEEREVFEKILKLVPSYRTDVIESAIESGKKRIEEIMLNSE